MLLFERRPGSLLEYLHFDLSDILVSPLIKNGAEKSTPSLSRHGELTHAAFGARLRFNHRQEGHIGGFNLLEESVDLDGVLDIVRIHHTQDIGLNLMLLQE
ncbi:hypothetical protein ES703_79182 [subsurface metagenome]